MTETTEQTIKTPEATKPVDENSKESWDCSTSPFFKIKPNGELWLGLDLKKVDYQSACAFFDSVKFDMLNARRSIEQQIMQARVLQGQLQTPKKKGGIAGVFSRA